LYNKMSSFHITLIAVVLYVIYGCAAIVNVKRHTSNRQQKPRLYTKLMM